MSETQSCITSSSLISYAAIFVSIFTQCNNAQISCLREHFLLTSPHTPFKYCFSFQTKLNPCMDLKKGLGKCIVTLYYKKLIAAIHCTYKAELQSYLQS